MAQNAVADYAAYELLLGYLPPADHANLRLVSRSWQVCAYTSLASLVGSINRATAFLLDPRRRS